jgi:hypothetical protein
MKPDRPDLTQVAPAVLAYIELLEAELQSVRESPANKIVSRHDIVIDR